MADEFGAEQSDFSSETTNKKANDKKRGNGKRVKKRPGRKKSLKNIEIKVSELIDEDDGEVRVDVKYNAKGAPRVRAVKSNIHLPDINPVLARMNNSDGFQPLDLEDYLVSKSGGQARLSFKQEDESFNDVLLTPETKCALRMDHRRMMTSSTTSARDRHVYGCPFCNYMGVKKNWLRHIRSEHRDVEGLVFCTYLKTCQMPFNKSEALDNHIAATHKDRKPNGPRSTPIASYESLATPNKETKLPLKLSANPSDLDRELELVSDTGVLVDQTVVSEEGEDVGVKPYTCVYCDYSDTSRRKWAGHMLEVHSTAILYQCGECSQSFETEEDLSEHAKATHQQSNSKVWDGGGGSCGSGGKKSWQCSYCGKAYLTRKGCREHEALRHAPQKLRHRCDHVDEEDGGSPCLAAFYSAKELVVHKRKHTGELPFICGYCGNRYRSKATLVQHERQQHFGTEPTVECPVCKKEMKKRNLDYHLKRHEGYFQIPCKICGKTFTSVGARNRHEKIHSGDKKHSCAFCGKSFVQRSNLQAHERIHTGEKPYLCQHCGEGFMQPTRRNVHQMTCKQARRQEQQVSVVTTHPVPDVTNTNGHQFVLQHASVSGSHVQTQQTVTQVLGPN